MCKEGNRDGQPTLLNAPFGRAVAELSRKGRLFGSCNVLADSCKVIYIAVYSNIFFLPVLHLNKT